MRMTDTRRETESGEDSHARERAGHSCPSREPVDHRLCARKPVPPAASPQAGDLVIKKGEDGDYFYMVNSGKFDVFLTEGTDGKAHRTYTAGESFGELALLYNAPRAATALLDSTLCIHLEFPFD